MAQITQPAAAAAAICGCMCQTPLQSLFVLPGTGIYWRLQNIPRIVTKSGMSPSHIRQAISILLLNRFLATPTISLLLKESLCACESK